MSDHPPARAGQRSVRQGTPFMATPHATTRVAMSWSAGVPPLRSEENDSPDRAMGARQEV
jgi:hypothetical protein